MVILQIPNILNTWHSELDFVKVLLKRNKKWWCAGTNPCSFGVFEAEILREESNQLCFVLVSRLACCRRCCSSSNNNKKYIVCILTGNLLNERRGRIRCDFWVYWALCLVLSLSVPVWEQIHYAQVCCDSRSGDAALLPRVLLLQVAIRGVPGSRSALGLCWQPPGSGPWVFAVVGAYPSAVSLLLRAHLQFNLVHVYLFSWTFNLVPIPDGPNSSEAQKKKLNK